MKWMAMVLFVGACTAPADLMPLVGEDGALAGSYDPEFQTVEVVVSGASLQVPDGSMVALEDGHAVVPALELGDEVVVLDEEGLSVEVLVVDEAAMAADGRFSSCAEGSM
jgi:hypothetical protein